MVETEADRRAEFRVTNRKPTFAKLTNAEVKDLKKAVAYNRAAGAHRQRLSVGAAERADRTMAPAQVQEQSVESLAALADELMAPAETYWGPLTVVTEASNLPAQITTIAVKRAIGKQWEAQIYRDLVAQYGDDYVILWDRAVRNQQGATITFNDRRLRPDFQVVNRHTGRLVEVVEAASGTRAYLTSKLGKIAIYQTMLRNAGMNGIPIRLAEQYRTRPRFGAGLSVALGAWSMLLSAGSLDDPIYLNGDPPPYDMEWLWEHDRDLACALMPCHA